MLFTRVTRGAVFAAFFLVFLGLTQIAHSATCGEKYTVKEGDTLNGIAQEAYGLANKWTLIYYANQKQFGNAPILVPGNQIMVPCIKSPDQANITEGSTAPGTEVDAGKIEVSRIKGDIQLLTADDYEPFTGRALPQGGLITDVINRAMDRLQKEAGGPGFRISWVNDWSSHLNPLLSRKAFDMGFPWFKPDCEHYNDLDEPAQFRCDTFFFSKPVFEILVLFFTLNDSSFAFASDSQVDGKRLCRPAGYFTFDLDKDGRNWVKDDKVVLLRPQNVEECFQMLARNEVDAVALNEFTGRAAIKKLGMDKEIRVVERPVSVLNLHVIIAKTHPRARTYLHYINSSLTYLRNSGEYNTIVDEHLSRFWGTQDAS